MASSASEEFNTGHHAGALNVPYLFRVGSGMTKNPKFIEEVMAHFRKDDEIIVVGCRVCQKPIDPGKTATSYRELEARKSRVKELEKLYMDMSMTKELQVPEQPGSSECKYYVMRYMRDTMDDISVLEANFHGKKEYSQSEVDVVRDEWAPHITELIGAASV